MYLANFPQLNPSEYLTQTYEEQLQVRSSMFAIAIVVVVIANLFAATDAQLTSEQIEKLNREIDRIWEEDDDDDGDSGFLMVVGGCAG
eukprot:gene29817-30650_t